MTLKPTIEADKASGTVLTSSEWNVDTLQSARYLQELVAGSNSDKIPGTALANPLTVGALSTTGNLSVGGSTTMFSLLASSGTFTSTLTASGGLSATTGTFSGNVSANGAILRRMTGGVSTGVGVPNNGSATFSVTLDDAITPTRAVAVAFGTGANSAVIYNAQVTALGSGTVSGVVNCNSTGGTVTVHVIAY